MDAVRAAKTHLPFTGELARHVAWSAKLDGLGYRSPFAALEASVTLRRRKKGQYETAHGDSDYVLLAGVYIHEEAPIGKHYLEHGFSSADELDAAADLVAIVVMDAIQALLPIRGTSMIEALYPPPDDETHYQLYKVTAVLETTSGKNNNLTNLQEVSTLTCFSDEAAAQRFADALQTKMAAEADALPPNVSLSFTVSEEDILYEETYADVFLNATDLVRDKLKETYPDAFATAGQRGVKRAYAVMHCPSYAK